jgi:hypothetical protein
MSKKSEQPPILQIPANFNSMVYDFVTDLSTTFPEYSFLWKKWQKTEMPLEEQEELFLFFTKAFPERFFDILYQNDDIFNTDSETNTVFLPNVDFKLLFRCGNITENTKKAIWKYLQLILISVLNSVQNKQTFGDAASLFEGIDENVIQEKLNETIDGISNFFKNLGTEKSDKSSSEFNPENSSENIFEKMAKDMHDGLPEEIKEDQKNTFDFGKMGVPNAEELNEHLKGLFDGKIGSLAKEMAEEITEDMKDMFETEGTDDIRSTQDILKKMIKNPKKIMDLMKNIGSKLQTKMKSGEISEEEIMKEASELMGKMKGFGDGKGGFADIMKNMAQGLAGGKTKVNMDAINRMGKQMANKERMMSKLEQKRQEKNARENEKVKYSLNTTGTPNDYVFTLDEEEKQEKSNGKDLDELVKSIECVGKTPSTNPKKKKGKK